MKKQNVIDLAAYREEHQHKTPDDATPSSPAVISDELKTAIEILIDRLRAEDPTKKIS